MSGDPGVTPERLAQLADGAAPETEAERDALALMADVRGLAEPAPDAVRERVRAIASRDAHGATGWRRWLAPGDRRRVALTAAPVAAAIVALAIAIPVATRDDGGSAPPPAADAPAAAREGAAAEAAGAAPTPAPDAVAPRAVAPAAPDADRSTGATETHQAEPRADAAPGAGSAGLDRAVARARATLERAGATGVETRERAGGTAATVVADVPAARVDAAAEALEAQGARVTAGPQGEEGTAPVRATVTAGG
jgi:hypothetical protein